MSDIVMTVNVVEFPETQIAYLSHIGSPDRVLDTAREFIEWRKETGLSPVKSSRSFGIPYGDPATVPPEKFRWDVCGSVQQEIPSNRYGVTNGVIPAGKCAVLRHKGSHNELSQSVWFLIKNWLPNSGEVMRDHPVYFEYLNFIFEVDESELLTDIYLPLQ
jgi:AraC family transcriptional regulator